MSSRITPHNEQVARRTEGIGNEKGDTGGTAKNSVSSLNGAWWIVVTDTIRLRESVTKLDRSAMVAGPEFVEVFRRE